MPVERMWDVARLRALLREECADCPACDESEAERPTDEMLAAWLQGDPLFYGADIPNAAWIGHLRNEWRSWTPTLQPSANGGKMFKVRIETPRGHVLYSEATFPSRKDARAEIRRLRAQDWTGTFTVVAA